MEPAERLKLMVSKSSVDVSKNIPAIRYYRTGVEMARMAKIYYEEGKLDQAYVLYMKYIELFLEKIREHPGFAQVPEVEKKVAKDNIKMMLPKAEELKRDILAKYKKEFKTHLEMQKKRLEEERLRAVASAPSKDLLPEFEFDPYDAISTSSKRTVYASGLRQILLPSSLIPKFLELAKANTSKGIETCALLTGTLQNDVLTVTLLLLPQQHGTPDDCTAENDLATFNVIEDRGLITLGWIHTHPTQDAFLSSVDLHSQFGYQSMLPEAIAIVCAPKYSNEIFRLTDMGLDIVRKCSAQGFHPHSGPRLFETADHVKLVDIHLGVIDLRLRTFN